MALKCGIVGLPNVGKSSLFNALCKTGAASENYPFCTIEPNIGSIPVPDSRINELSNIIKPQKTLFNSIIINDIAGLVQGAHKGEGLGNQFLSHIKNAHALIHLLRCFEDNQIIHVEGRVNPIADKEIIELELQLKDLETVEKKINNYKKRSNSGISPEEKKEFELLKNAFTHLQSGQSLRTLSLNAEDKNKLAPLSLLTLKPLIYVCNVHENDIITGNKWVEEVKKMGKEEGAQVLTLSVAIESEIANLDDENDRKDFMENWGLKKGGMDQMIRATYQLLDLITFFTAGEKEVRAWTLKKGLTAPKAAGQIHSDFEKGFIRAEVIKYEDFKLLKSEVKCKEKGKMRVEGKDYIIEDGDILHFRFNV